MKMFNGMNYTPYSCIPPNTFNIGKKVGIILPLLCTFLYFVLFSSALFRLGRGVKSTPPPKEKKPLKH